MLSSDRIDPIAIQPSFRTFPVAAGVRIFAGALVVLDEQGNARPGRDDVATDVAVGYARRRCDNLNGVAGALRVEVRCGILRFRNDSAEPVTQAMIQQEAYVVDDNTVSASSMNATRTVAGIVYDVVQDFGMEWVEVAIGPIHTH